jgi:FtsP/CotA-like multicopper oxidase with cupredoxin domain
MKTPFSIIRNFVTISILAGTLACVAAGATAATVTIDLFVRPGALNTVDGRSLPALCYSLDSLEPSVLPAPILTLDSGDELEVTLHNQDVQPHGFEVVGLGGTNSSVEPGMAETFSFSFPGPGTWLYRDPVNYPVGQGLGLSGAVEVVETISTYHNEFLWLLGDHSEEWLTANEASQIIDTTNYNPNYFTINGLSGLDTSNDPRAHITGQVGDNLLIRVVNGGLRLHSLHFHGYHVEVIARDGQPLPAPLEKDTVAIPVGGTAEFLLRPHQPGVFPIHDHVVLSVAANGVYPLGMIVFTDIQE